MHRRDRRRTTTPDESAPRPPDLVNRQFTADRPDRLWLADITCVRTWEGWVYVAFVLDAFSRRIVGWQLADHLRTDLPLDGLEMALWQRGRERPVQPGTLIHHSDRGCQYVSFRYTTRLADLGVTASVCSVADSYDNAMAESLNATFKTELIHRRIWRTRDQVEYAIVEWVGRYNHRRLHTAIGDVPPIEYETAYYRSINTPAPTSARYTGPHRIRWTPPGPARRGCRGWSRRSPVDVDAFGGHAERRATARSGRRLVPAGTGPSRSGPGRCGHQRVNGQCRRAKRCPVRRAAAAVVRDSNPAGCSGLQPPPFPSQPGVGWNVGRRTHQGRL
ncbi:IS3 family transposase [Actinomadura sp. NAK00032]|uniref:IS3 family transposase n=1 Tax=Actinomadura sp. NAK00032 TaxID=2742128 RepID=UPI00158FE599|nr:IS3 family transposase [Actinomadura sp. NAK00032]QKW36236.1 IS3 family transposase [Actinomadura sp. NAK00032]